MGLPDHVVIALDFSEPSEVAARAGFELAALTGAKQLTVLHATRGVVLPAGETPELRARLEALRLRVIEAAQAQLDELCDRAVARPCERSVVCGRPSEVIPRTLAEIGATLLVVGTHARKGLKRVFVGSIAEDLIRRLDLPVLVTMIGDDEVPPDLELRGLRNLVLGLDLDEQAPSVVDAVVSLFGGVTGQRPLTVHLVHALDRRAEVEALVREQSDALQSETRLVAESLRDAGRERAQELLQRSERVLRASGFEVVLHLEEGDFEEQAAALVAELPAQLLAVGTHGRHGAPVLELGSTTGRVVRSSNVSVLVVPTRSAEARPSGPPP